MDPIIRKSRLISIHTPAKGVTCKHPLYLRCWTDFNPHSREGSDLKILFRFCNFPLISIHTPAKGVTLPAIVFVVGLDISIHTPAKGVTCLYILIVFRYNISIHTPAKGVTYDAYQFFSFHLISIHTPAKGVTRIITMPRLIR